MRWLRLACAVTLGLLAPASARADTRSFSYTGAQESFTVPAGVTSVHVTAVGGPGGDGWFTASNGVGGLAGTAAADVAVTPGQALFVKVGGPGADASNTPGPRSGGYNGGGAGNVADLGGDNSGGGGGGGGSDVRAVSADSAGTLESRLVVAGGGGGGGTDSVTVTSDGGNGGGPSGGTGVCADEDAKTPGAGGTQAQGGAAGTSGMVGAAGTGGGGTAGGGGGWFGGGGAGPCGAGGGSGHFGAGTSNSIFGTATADQAPGVTIDYTAAAATPSPEPSPAPSASPSPSPSPTPTAPQPPETTLIKHPKSKLKVRAHHRLKVVFRFTASVPNATFRCRLDDKRSKPCDPRQTYRVRPGFHVFKVVAVSDGVADPTPATYSFRVKRKPHKRR